MILRTAYGQNGDDGQGSSSRPSPRGAVESHPRPVLHNKRTAIFTYPQQGTVSVSSLGPSLPCVFFPNDECRLCVDARRLQWDVAGFAFREGRSPSSGCSNHRLGRARKGITTQARLVDVSRVLVPRTLGCRGVCAVFPISEVDVNRAGESKIGGDNAEEELEVRPDRRDAIRP